VALAEPGTTVTLSENTRRAWWDALDGVRDTANMPVEDEPQRVRDDLDAFTR
jgi:hypothetical protein